MTADQLFQKYWDILSDEVAASDESLVRFALRLAVHEAYSNRPAPSMLANERSAEAAVNQIGELNEWLSISEPALHYHPEIGTAGAMLKAIQRRDDDLMRLRSECSALQQQIAQMDCDEATLRQRVVELQGEVDRLTRENVIAVDAFNQISQAHTNGANPTPTPNWNRNHWAWDGLPRADLDVIDQLETGAMSFRRLDKTLRRDLVMRVVRSLAVDGEVKTAVYDSHKPSWMPTNGAVTMFSPNGRWSGLVAMALGEAEPTPA